ncbi:MAG: EcsC family protein [Planctomycetota bacterium]
MTETPEHELSASVREEISQCRQVLTERGLADRLTELLGTPMTASLRMLPEAGQQVLQAAVDKALMSALQVALATMRDDHASGSSGDSSSRPLQPKLPAQPKLLAHKFLAGVTGAAGGAFGLASVAAELPVSTVLILRSIADIARSQGEDLGDLETRLACLEVFALDGGGRDAHPQDDWIGDEKDWPGDEPENDSDPARHLRDSTRHFRDSTRHFGDSTEVGYFAVRAALAKQVSEASKYLLAHKTADLTAPPLVKLLSSIGGKFGVVVSQKMTAQALPVIGAVGGALINSYFIAHYQELARAHFAIRRLERDHGSDAIQAAWRAGQSTA